MGSREKLDFFILFNLLLTGKLNGGFVSIRSAILIVAFSVYYCDTVYFFASLVSISVVYLFFSFRSIFLPESERGTDWKTSGREKKEDKILEKSK